ncbi:hypothetical protein D7X96_36025 [Corallococcus interemptor]|uniref:Uncharacterized protein n=1 Tax=Corallococcus interemptor TaxID=2316720 RepID=A0A3A8PRA9_9BACT|nr:hypothetical protein D7X96_36025 [Corallococcus interemptor]
MPSEIEVPCKHCGAVFRVRKFKSIARDKDSLSCTECGNELMSWNGGVMYLEPKLISGATKKPQ